MRGSSLLLVAIAACSPATNASIPDGEAAASAGTSARPKDFEPARRATIAAGVAHSCAVRHEAVVCWGYNGHGQLGDGTRRDRLAPVVAKGIDRPVAVAVGYHHSCALQRDGTVQCWGGNELGQIGDGSEVVHLVPAPVDELSGVVQIATSGDHTCALRRDGRVLCWGSNYAGALGDGTSEHRRRPTLVHHLRDAVEIAVGFSHSCARRAGGEVRCWGENQRGELSGSDPVEPGGFVRVAGLDEVVQLALGRQHGCALQKSGRVACWGDNGQGQLGSGTRGDETGVPHPVAVTGLDDAVEIASGWDTSCARTERGRVLCWGTNGQGELGGGSGAELSAKPVEVKGIDDAVELAVGTGYACALRQGGALWCWGATGNGQLGVVPAPTPRHSIREPALQIAAGQAHACLLDPRGKVHCWGSNEWGQLGIGSNAPHRGMAEVAGLSEVVELAAGQHHTCARTQRGAVWCWGDDRHAKGHIEHVPRGDKSVYVQVDGAPDPRMNAPVELAGVRDATALSAIEGRSCLTRADGEVLCWHAATGSVAPIDGIEGAVEAVMGAAHACARLAGGTVRCWGSNFEGRLGDGTTERHDAPVTVKRLDGGVLDRVIALGAGRLHTCALREDGRVLCWGTNFFGQLGDGTAMQRSAAVEVVGLDDAVEIHAGKHHSCARRKSGRVFCWGAGSEGQLGDGTRNDRLVPTEVIDLDGAVSLSGGGEYTCAVRKQGSALCWGKIFGKPAVRPSPSPPAPLAGWR